MLTKERQYELRETAQRAAELIESLLANENNEFLDVTVSVNHGARPMPDDGSGYLGYEPDGSKTVEVTISVQEREKVQR